MNEFSSSRGRWIRLRMGVICGLLALGLGLVVAGGWELMIVDGSAWRELAERQRQRRLRVKPKRGTIYDRNGSALSVSVDVPSVTLDSIELLHGATPEQTPALARAAAARIATALGLDAADIEQRILAKRRFAWLRRNITSEQAEAVRRLAAGEDGGPPLEGVAVEGEGRRYYPRRELGAQVLGFVAPDGEGKDGVELGVNGDLRGHLEQLSGLRDRSGRLLFSDGVEDDQALAGHDVYLTIDQGIQYVAERELASAIRTHEAKGGSVVAVDPKTGEILAMASMPTFNPNDYGASDPAARRDRGRSDRFEPGSTMKIFTVSAALAAGAITPTQQLYCEKGVMPLDNIVIRDTHPSEWLTIPQVLALSSNICAAKMGLSVGSEPLYEAFRRFGFGQETGVPLPGESAGVLRPRSRPWVQVETAAASFGQGVSVTNLQMAMALAAIANGGELMEPQLVRRVASATGDVIREAVPRVRRRVIPEGVARTVAEMMIAVTEGEGTGAEGAIDGYEVAGKTATAQKADPRTGQYSLDEFVASFIGFVPARRPVIAIAVMIDEPMVEHAGGSVAAPVFRRVASSVLKYFGLKPRGTKAASPAELARAADPAHATYAYLRRRAGEGPAVQEAAPTTKPAAGQIALPDLTGLPVRSAIRKTLETGARPRVVGTGLLARQEPPPGAVVSEGATVVLYFEPAT